MRANHSEKKSQGQSRTLTNMQVIQMHSCFLVEEQNTASGAHTLKQYRFCKMQTWYLLSNATFFKKYLTWNQF